MDTTEGLLAAWRAAEMDVDAAEPGSTEHRRARYRADLAKTAYLARVEDVFDVEGHRHTDPPPRGPGDTPRSG
jgi:hypothetical protein